MSRYEFLLFLHIAAAIVWVGGGLMMQFFGLRAPAARDPSRVAILGGDIEWLGLRVLTPASFIAFVAGILLVVDGPWSFGDDWITIGLVLFAITFLAGFGFFGPESGRLGKLIEAGSPEAGPRLARLLLFTRLDLVLLFLIVYDMSVKPSFDDQGALLWGLAGAAIAAALVVWRTRAAPAPAVAAATD
jgi:uncharacterized membrane protein